MRFVLIAFSAHAPIRFFTSDSYGYVDNARALFEIKRFAHSPEEPGLFETIRTPGYPLFLAASYSLFGVNQAIAIGIQSFLSLITIILTFWIGCQIWNPKVGLLSSLLLTLDLNTLGFSLMLLSETLFTLFLTGFLASTIYILKRDPDRWKGVRLFSYAGISGTLLVFATFVRPLTYFSFALVALIFEVWLISTHWPWKRHLQLQIGFFLPFVLLVGGWQLRNQQITGSGMFSQIEAINMYWYRAAGVIALRDHISLQDAQKKMGIYEPQAVLYHPELGETWQEDGVNTLLKHPFLYMRTVVGGILKMFMIPGNETVLGLIGVQLGKTSPLGDLFRLPPREYITRWMEGNKVYLLTFIFALLHMFLVYTGFLIGSVQSLVKRQGLMSLFLLIGMLFYLVLVSAGPEAYYRFRVPVTPILVLFAARGIYLITFQVKGKNKFAQRFSSIPLH
jgi:4-amino-4-deoxy-L-arabinose transferase-like glycosyltransferase